MQASSGTASENELAADYPGAFLRNGKMQCRNKTSSRSDVHFNGIVVAFSKELLRGLCFGHVKLD